MNDTQFSTVLTNHWLMRNPMVRIPLEAYFREQFDKKVHERFNESYTACIDLGDDKKDTVRGVDHAWVSFQVFIASSYPKLLSLDKLKVVADWCIDSDLNKLDYRFAKSEAERQQIFSHKEELEKEKDLLERCYRKHIFIYCVFMMAVMAVWQFSWVSAIALSIAGGVFSETEGYMNFLKRLCKGKEKNEENAHKNDR